MTGGKTNRAIGNSEDGPDGCGWIKVDKGPFSLSVVGQISVGAYLPRSFNLPVKKLR